ncbi:GNAT family N-acetyltransferase [Aspergillus saccharolyticus JOP 1030-1]|uniref:GNAT family acetyltransferase n=1 Tax=Aspergillus saccharolyticus JOP 1030-1 TaxID=1450539 RepID=A0A318ZZD0_9EURO|nr:GNAT family acetyltransferase [Aspergillus saccharolyticus JOP 1030-1]PYH40712.1 GNAT family acetyltransferase [Aspergillus saccharolyticus JOP 1030-1]
MSYPTPLRSQRLIYRAVEDTPEDEDFIHSIQSDPEAYANSTPALPKPQAKRDTVNGYKKSLMERTLLAAILVLPPDSGRAEEEGDERAKTDAGSSAGSGTPIGIISLRKEGGDYAHHRGTSITLDIARPYRNQGYGSEAIHWVLHWAFQRAGLHRVEIQALSYNEGAVRLYERLGFRVEGRRREAFWHDGKWHDDLVFGMLEREWRERQTGREDVHGN